MRRTSQASVLINALTVIDGGGRSYITNLLRELDADPRGFRFTVLAAEGQLTERDTGRSQLLTLRLAGDHRALQLLQRVAFEQVVLPWRARAYDLLYCVADMVPLATSVPTVVALRNLNIYDDTYYNTPRLRALRMLVPLGLRRARRMIFPSQAAADAIAPRVGISAEQVAVVRYGIAREAFDAPDDPVDAGAPYLFLPAALERHKNMEVLLRGLPRVSDPTLQLWIAGQSQTDPVYAAEIRDLAASLGLDERVRFLGPVPYKDVVRYHRHAVALVFPSKIETFGHPLLEAMLAETPIVAADIPAFREIAGDAALFFAPDDVDGLVAGVERVLGDAASRSQRVELGRKRASEFTWKRSVDRLCQVFEEALGAG